MLKITPCFRFYSNGQVWCNTGLSTSRADRQAVSGWLGEVGVSAWSVNELLLLHCVNKPRLKRLVAKPGMTEGNPGNATRNPTLSDLKPCRSPQLRHFKAVSAVSYWQTVHGHDGHTLGCLHGKTSPLMCWSNRSASVAPVCKPLFQSDDSLAFKKPEQMVWKAAGCLPRIPQTGGSKKDFTWYQNRARPVKWYMSHERGGNTPLVTQRAETHLSCLWQFSTDWETVFTEERPTRLVAPLLSTRASEQNVEAFGVFRNIWRFLWWTKSVFYAAVCVCVVVCSAAAT